MRDAEAKVAFLTVYADTVAEVAKAFAAKHTARVYSRALYLAVDAFLVFAPNVKNRAAASGTLPRSEVIEVENALRRLRRDYEGYFDKVRDRMAAHQQELEIEELITVWNDVDASTVHILRDDMLGVSLAFERHGVLKPLARSAKLREQGFRAALAANGDRDGVRIGYDRHAITRGGVAMLSLHPTQEKTQRILTAFDHLRVLSRLPDELASVSFAHKAQWDLIIVDLVSALDNLLTDDPGTTTRAPDPSLLTLWQNAKFGGAATLAAFSRDVALDTQLRRIRDKACAHMDAQMPLDEVVKLHESIPAEQVCAYAETLYDAFRTACAQDLRSSVFLGHDERLRGVVGVSNVGATKPF